MNNKPLYAIDGPVEHMEPKNPSGVAVLGEAPGADEIKQKAPFVGRSGQLLESLLNQAGFKRDELLIVNVFRWRPIDNKVDYFFASKKAATDNNIPIMTDLPPMSGKFCLEDYRGEISRLPEIFIQHRIKYIIAAGRTALWATTGLSGISKHAGQMMRVSFLPTARVIPIYHPAFLLRNNNTTMRNNVVEWMKSCR